MHPMGANKERAGRRGRNYERLTRYARAMLAPGIVTRMGRDADAARRSEAE
jgi:hypothetical protein